MATCNLIFLPAECSGDELVNQDIAGLGVLLSFLISAWLSVFLAAAAYWTCNIPEKLLGRYDILFSRRSANRSERWTEVIRDTIMFLSDQQIVTGIAVLIAGFVQLPNLSVYEWHTIVYLAWMSSTVHLASLTYLRYYLQQNSVLRSWRLVGMVVLLGLLLAAIYPTSSNLWECLYSGSLTPGNETGCISARYPARCYWNHQAYDYLTFCPGRNAASASGVLSYIFLAASYSWKVVVLYAPTRNLALKGIHCWFLGPLERLIRKVTLWRFKWRREIVYTLLLCVYVPLFAVFELAGSFAGSLWTVSIGLGWGTLQLMGPRQILGELLANNAQQSSSWGFGQILPMLLLVYPFVALGSQFFATKKTKTTKTDDGQQSPCMDYSVDRTTPTAISVFTSFSRLDRTNESTFEDLFDAIYRTKTFKLILVFVNLGIAGTLGFAFALAWNPENSRDAFFTLIGQTMALAVLFYGLFSAFAICCSSMRRRKT